MAKKTSRKKLGSVRSGIKAMNQWLKRIRNAVGMKAWWKTLCRKLSGHYRYYGVSGNMEGHKAVLLDNIAARLEVSESAQPEEELYRGKFRGVLADARSSLKLHACPK